jgi:hypothetical protein
MATGLVSEGLSQAVADRVANLPPVASLFAAFLGYNPMGQLIPAAALHALTADQQAVVTGTRFFPELLSGPFMVGIKIAFTISALLYVAAALASWLGGSTARAEDVEEASAVIEAVEQGAQAAE